MKALRFESSTKKLEVQEIPIPKVTRPDDVLIKIAYAGVCGTDIHIIQGHFPCSKEIVTMGHEFCGTVVEVGCGVYQVKKGDRVAVDPNAGCGSCRFCHSGQPHFCPIGGINDGFGVWKNGGWAEFCLIPIQEVHKLPDTITLEQAALAEPISCISHGWDKLLPIQVGQKVLIQGAGIIGSLFVSICHLQGHRNVTVSEPNVTRLNLLKKLKVGYDLVTPVELRKNHDLDPTTYLFDVIIDCSGYAPAMEYAVELLQKGGKLCCFGVPSAQVTMKIKPFDIFYKELTIFGVLTNPYSFPKAIGLIEALGDRYLNYENLGIKVFTLDEYEEAMKMLTEGKIPKAIFKPI